MKTTMLRPYLKLVAIAEDEATQEFFAIIKFRDRYGEMRRVTRPLTDLDDRNALAKTLTNLGMYFSNMDTKSKRAVLGKLLDSNRKTKRISFAARVGWYRGRYHKYVLANGVIGTADSEVAVRPPRLKSPGHAAAIGRRGEHAEWLRTVAAHAKFSSRMLFAISAAVAAPLLGMAKLPSFGILVHGPGKAGKSTMLLAAASVGGYGQEQDLPNFRATDTAFGEIPAAFNDSLLPLNELGLLKGSAVEKYLRLRDLTYGFAEGRGTTYSKLAPIDGVGGGDRGGGMGGNRGHGQRVAADLGEPGASPFPRLPPERSGQHDVGNGLDLPPGWKVVVPVAPASKMPEPNAELEPSGSPESPSPLPAEVASVGTPGSLVASALPPFAPRRPPRPPWTITGTGGLTDGSRTLAVGRQYAFRRRGCQNQPLGTGALTPPGARRGTPSPHGNNGYRPATTINAGALGLATVAPAGPSRAATWSTARSP